MSDARDLEQEDDGKGSAPGGEAAGRSVIEFLQRKTGEARRVTLRDEESANVSAPLINPRSEEKASIPEGRGTYQFMGEIARGGMGVILKGHDTDLGRDVAVKVLDKRLSERMDVVQRFVEEAQIGGQLQHPGIVPVYELGMMADERPYFTMKLVKGRTLAALLAERETPSSNRGHLIEIFEAICQTMAYAHSRGVIHRDLKPANIMVGAFGEVQVVDWGLAKVLSRGGTADEKLAREVHTQMTVLETVRSEGSGSGTESMVGSILGTPAYMPPEQAMGLVDQMDERSDVFALGAILCEILTGQPPYMGTQDELIAMAAMAKLDDAHARLEACGGEPEMVELATRCLMPAPAARPKSAAVVAEVVHQHLAAAEARVHEARVEAAEAEGRAAALKRTQVLGAGLLAAIAAGLLLSLWFWREADRAAATAPPSLAPAIEDSRARLVEATRRAASGAHLQELEQRFEQLQAEAAQRSYWSFASFEDYSQHQVLSLMSETWQWLFDPDTGMLDGISPEYGWGIERRKAWAEQVAERTTEGAEAKPAWEEAIASIANERECPLYRGLEVTPQLGLLPLRRNAASGLWEFAHLQTGERARVGADGELRIGPETGLVFVLLPGGEFAMGAQPQRPDLPNFDPRARASEGPVHTVELQPFFLSKYEMTQAQWERFTGANPSYYGPDHGDGHSGIDGTHPVERVSWYDSERVCRWLGLSLPSEAQWEFAARAGTSSAWWSGAERESLRGGVNLADRAAREAGAPWPQIEDWPELDDGFALHAPVDAFAPNAFGLHQVHGNVFEWCLDEYAADFYTRLHGPDPVAVDRDASGGNRVSRGGSYRSTASSARSAFRQNDDPDSALAEVGLRPARALSRP